MRISETASSEENEKAKHAFKAVLTISAFSNNNKGFDNFSRGGSYQKVKKLSPLIGVMIKFKVYETHFL